MRKIEKAPLRLTSIKQMWIFIAQFLAGNEEFSVSVEGQEGHHVVLAVVPYGSIRVWILWWRWSVPPEPLLVNAFIENGNKRIAIVRCKRVSVLKLQNVRPCVCVCVPPVNKSMVEKKYGVIRWALHRRHGSVHEHVESGMHAPARTVPQPSLRIPESCKMKVFN